MSAPYMQLYVADYLGDTRHLTTEQHGAYLLLLMAMWRSGGRLPNDDKKLARIVCCTPSRWAKISSDVLDFFTIEGDEISNARLSVELQIASEKSIKRAKSGKLGARANALKKLKGVPANDDGLPQHSPDIRTNTEDKSSDAGRVVAPIDHDAEAWRQAVVVLTTQGRQTQDKARGFFGRLLSQNKLQARDLLPSLASATVSGTQDPQGYLAKAAEAIARRRIEDAKPKRVAWV